VPQIVEIHSSLPKTDGGKIKKSALHETERNSV